MATRPSISSRRELEEIAMKSDAEKRPQFALTYELEHHRRRASTRRPAAHQTEALQRMGDWYERHARSEATSHRADAPIGGLLVLPTGGGKTFSAVRFLCERPLSDGYKVLWLAHTHHLLEQAFNSLVARKGVSGKEDHGDEIGRIREPRKTLRVRVVSSTPGHCEVRDIRADDDFVIATLQTITNAHKRGQTQWKAFLKSAKQGLVVVFDEAHHSPAPTYHKLIESLREEHPRMVLLGLTATPTYTDERRRGWLTKMFPQGVLYQAEIQTLIASGVLAKPRVEECQTRFSPDFKEDDYARWVKTFRDLPEDIIDRLARDTKRNEFIADHYARNKKRYGRTIMFTDRWFQCVAIREGLKKRGVEADFMFSAVESSHDANLALSRRDPKANDIALQRFRSGEVDVLINIRMLTEGTDVPQAKTAFLTRQTTSAILLTQMVGRVLRGPVFGGTDEAFIVSFIDDWRETIQWARFELPDGETGEVMRPERVRRAMQLVSVERVSRFVDALDRGESGAAGDFLKTMPVGWYEVEYQTTVGDGASAGDDLETMHRLVMVFEGEGPHFQALLREPSVSSDFDAPDLDARSMEPRVDALREKFFAGAPGRPSGDLRQAVLDLLRHLAQTGTAPVFHPFEARANHDLEPIAADYIQRDLGLRAFHEAVKQEFERSDRYWPALFRSFERFKKAVEDVVGRQMNPSAMPPRPEPTYDDPGPGDRLVDDELRARIMKVDKRCLGCGETRAKLLQIDHIEPHYDGGELVAANLQVLCRTCNLRKKLETINFRSTRPMPRKLRDVAVPEMPKMPDAKSPETWRRLLQREVNFFLRCGAVKEVVVEDAGEFALRWEITPVEGVDLVQVQDHLDAVFQVAVKHMRSLGLTSPRSILLEDHDGQHRIVAESLRSADMRLPRSLPKAKRSR